MKRTLTTLCAAVATTLAAACLRSQEPAAGAPRALAALKTEAAAAFAARNHAEAADLYREVVARDDQDAQAWHHLGYSLHVLGRLDEALEAHLAAARFDSMRATASYNVACVHALQGRPDESFTWLGKAADAGFKNAELMEWDPDLAALRADPRFQSLAQRLKQGRKNVAILVHEGVELLDFAGPGEVLQSADAAGGGRAFTVFTVATSREVVTAQGFVRITPEYTFADCPKPDVIVLPGGSTDRPLADPATMAWIAKAAPEAEVVLSVCTGAFLLAKAGLLDGLKATTHHGSIAGLRRKAPDTEVLEGRRYVDNGRIVTAGGVAAGIDGALHVVEKLCGRDAAVATARYMEYRWEPAPDGAGAGTGDAAGASARK